ncbi:hypothetical protein Droror1_Dr00004835 [Drosera rotundifolia]
MADRHINLFKCCSFLRPLGYLMILFVFAIVGVSYYAVVVLVWGPVVVRGGARGVVSVLVLIVFHVLLTLLMWSYIMVVFQDPGSVPENWRPMPEETREEATSTAQQLYVALDASSSALSSSDEGERSRYCSRCQNWKPPRCHHCSVCQKCILKMDHHCVWMVNCVGAHNYKFFLLFLIYTFLEVALDTVVLLPSIIQLFGKSNHHSFSPGSVAVTFLAFVLNLAFCLSLFGFLVMHASLLLSNTTTIEVYEKKKAVRWKYDLGWKKNFEQVFGKNKALWFLPIISKEDFDSIPALQGICFPVGENEEP